MKTFLLAVVGAVVMVLGACVASNEGRSVKPSAFLGDSAALLTKGGKDEGLLVYRKKGVDWKSYHKVILYPIEIWGESAALPPDQLADLQKLVDQFYATLKDKLSKDYTITDTPAPDAMRIQVAIMNGEQATAPLKAAKTVIPFAGFADTLWTFATGKPAFAGEASIEYMVKNSVSQELLAAGADRRVGGTQVGKATVTSWGDVQNSLGYWADLAIYAFCKGRGETNCTKPSAGLVENPV